MMSLLATDYRPQKFADLVGQDQARIVMTALVKGGNVPPSLIFDGTRGTGKTSSARIFASALNCENPVNGDCCTVCESCASIRTGESLAVHEIDAASNGGVDDIRALKELAQFSTGSKYRVIMLDEAHAMGKSAFNALLKVLEEPPPFTVFILLTTEPDKIMGTVQSRSMPVHFKPVTVKAIQQRLTTICELEKIEADADVLLEIATSGEGSLRDAVMLLDQANRSGDLSVGTVRLLTGKSDVAPRLVKAIVTQAHSEAQSLVSEYFETSGDAEALITDLIEQIQIRYATNSISPRQMVAAVKFLWDARSIGSNASRTSRIQMEAVVSLLYGVFYAEPAKKTTPQPILVKEEVKPSIPVHAEMVPDSLEELAALL
jgi:DNA polymerase-3 subunit gamma/tau